MKKAFIICFIIALGCSCSKEPPAIENSEKVLEFVQKVNTENVFPLVEKIHQLHIKDIPINNEGFPPKELFPSDHLTRGAAVGFVAQELSNMGYLVDTVVCGTKHPIAYNVVAEHKGTVNPNSVILVGCHLDAFYGGADDNTSAVAAMLEIARAAKNYSFKKTIRFVAFDLEEFGSIGSTRYIEAGNVNDVTGAIVMDLIAYSSDEPGSQKDLMGMDFPDKGNYLFVIGNKNSIELTQKIISFSHINKIGNPLGILAPNDGVYFLSSVFMRSDHGLLWYKGLPAVFFTDGANFRNPNYHKVTDTPSSLNQDFLKMNTKLVAAALAILAEIQL
ncbi:MAG: M28 family peptidase [Bacteroidales bacterium]|nr:M28 family peptidase [Bacteroidales bacterium]